MKMTAQVGDWGESVSALPPAKLPLLLEQPPPSDGQKALLACLPALDSVCLQILFVHTYFLPPKTEMVGEGRKEVSDGAD